MGAQLVREVASKTKRHCMATSTTTATTRSRRGHLQRGPQERHRRNNPTCLQRGIQKPSMRSRKELARISKKVKDKEEIKQVATVSANWDHTIGEIIADALDKVGKDGTVTVEEAKGIETSLDVVERRTVRRGLSLALLRHQCGRPRSGPRERLRSHPREEDQQRKDIASTCWKNDGQVEPPPPHHRGRSRRRSPRDPRREQAPWHDPSLRRQGPGLW